MSSNKSEQRQEAINFGQDDSVIDAYSGGSLALVDVSQVQDISGGLSLSQQGVDAKDVVDLVKQGGSALFGIVDQQGAALRNQFATVSNLVQGITGTQTETGRLVGQLALPITGIAALYFFFRK